ncbi:SURF1 family protein [Streptomyces sp. NPDC058486]|uniref:SURF1 family protein n=1 Tax=unclassified Streptomyces TaxID=2593676 RepID=UPI00364AF83F
MYRFLLAPRWWGLNTLLLLGIPFCLLMGMWQVERFEDRIDAHRGAQRPPAAAGQDARPLDQLLPVSKQTVGRMVTVRGRHTEQFVVPDRYMNGEKGHFVLSILRADSGRAIPVVRGWRPGDADHAALPPAPTGAALVTGVLQASEVAGSRGVGTTTALPHGQLGLISAAVLVNLVPHDMDDAWISESAPGEGLTAVPVNVPQNTGLDRKAFVSLGYSLQWFSFIGFALWMWFRFFRRETEAIRDGAVTR